jgi:alginate O-acetyltransferase complex protein AlgI
LLFATFPFLAFAVLTVVAANATRKGLGNPLLYFVINAVFLALFLGRVEAALLIGFTLWGYVLLRTPDLKGWPTITLGLLATLVLFVFLKKYSFLPARVRLQSIPAILGLSYVLFRVIHLLVDTCQEHAQPPSPARYLNYALSCFSLVSGPFQRYEDHAASINATRSGDPIAALSRITNGFLKIMILAPAVLDVHLWLKPQTNSGVILGSNLTAISRMLGPGADAAFVLGSIIGALIWVTFLYLNFSGYTDVVIGWAGLCGLNLPENFNAPIRANSFLDFWNRWHMSMTNWFKTYVFTYSLKRLTVRWPHRRFALFNTVTAFVVTFLLMGLWHGPDWPFAVCGLLLALGAAVNQTYRELLRRRIGSRRMTELGQRTWYQTLAAGLTFTYIAVVVTPFWISNAEYLRLLRDLIGPSFAIFAVLCIATGVLIQLSRYLIDSIKSLWTAARLRGFVPISAPASVAIRLNILILAILVDFHSVPDFIYKGF